MPMNTGMSAMPPTSCLLQPVGAQPLERKAGIKPKLTKVRYGLGAVMRLRII
jgi:hypothetical protein